MPRLPNLLVVTISVVLPYLVLWLFLAVCLHAETTVIDAGSATDSNFTGGTVYVIPAPPPAVTDATLRFNSLPFSYEIPCHVGWPYVVTFRFTEPSVTGVGQRVFTVRVNNQVVIDRLDLVAEGGLGKMLARSVIAVGADDGRLRIRFETNVRSAVVSLIEITPLFQPVATIPPRPIIRNSTMSGFSDRDYSTLSVFNSMTPVEIRVTEPMKRLRGIGRGKGNTLIPGSAYPPCPTCNGATSDNTLRAGFARGRQRYRCKFCRRTFNGAGVVIVIEPYDYAMICYHCGSKDARRFGKGRARTGRLGWCRGCGRKFIQGGLKDYQRYHLVLEQRIDALNLPVDVRLEVLQVASQDVLAGKGYCWSVELKTKEAWRNCRGEYGQRGSDHPKFREQMGQKMYD